jgi:hypothetical protein
VHELLHVLLAGLEDQFQRSTAELSHEAAAYLRGNWTRAEEWAIERLATTLLGRGFVPWRPTRSRGDGEPWLSGFE